MKTAIQKITHRLILITSIFLCFVSIAIAQTTSITYSLIIKNDSLYFEYKKNGKKGVVKGKHNVPPQKAWIKNSTSASLGQKPDNLISITNLNYELLDSLLWVYCNEYRVESGKNTCDWNDYLFKSVKHHSNYQAYYKVLAHGEKYYMNGYEKEKDYYDALSTARAEICLYNYFSDESVTYEDLAKKLIQQWKDSPGHNAIMISDNYSLSAFSAAITISDMKYILTTLKEYNPSLAKNILQIFPFSINHASDTFTIYSTGQFAQDNARIESVVDYLVNKSF